MSARMFAEQARDGEFREMEYAISVLRTSLDELQEQLRATKAELDLTIHERDTALLRLAELGEDQ